MVKSVFTCFQVVKPIVNKWAQYPAVAEWLRCLITPLGFQSAYLIIWPWIRGPHFIPNGSIGGAIPYHFRANWWCRGHVSGSGNHFLKFRKSQSVTEPFTASHLSLLFEWILLWNLITFPFQKSEFEAGDEWNFLSNSLKTVRLVDESDLWGRSHAYTFCLKETYTRAYKTASGAIWTYWQMLGKMLVFNTLVSCTIVIHVNTWCFRTICGSGV